MFNIFSQKVARNDAYSMESLLDIATSMYYPSLLIHNLKKTYKFKRFILGEYEAIEKCWNNLNNISFNHVFLIQKKFDERHV